MYRRRLVTLFLFSLALIIQALGPLVLEATTPDHSQERPIAMISVENYCPGRVSR